MRTKIKIEIHCLKTGCCMQIIVGQWIKPFEQWTSVKTACEQEAARSNDRSFIQNHTYNFIHIMSFDDFLEGKTLEIAKKLYKHPTEIQKEVIPVALAKHDIVAMSKTGSGKTAAFLFPVIQLLKEHSKITGCRAMILSPTRELSLQTAHFFRQYTSNSDLKYAAIIGGEPLPPQFEALTTNPDVLIATPGRMLHIVAETRYDLSRIQMVVIDEADVMFDQNLQDQLTGLLTLLPKERQTLLFSATIPQLLAEFTRINLSKAIVVRLDPSQLPDTLQFQFPYVTPVFKPALLVMHVESGIYQNAMVFVGTRQEAEFLSALFNDLGITSGCIYGAMEQDERVSSLAAFHRGARRVLFVTDVAARGIDIEGLDLVVNYDFPARPKLFLHRGGRAGRAGRKGHVISFLTHEELPYYCGAKESLKGTDWEVKRVSVSDIDNQLTQVDDALKRSHELRHLKKGMDDANQMYVKSRPAAKGTWLSMAKEMNIEAGNSSTEEALNQWRPTSVVFEQVYSNEKSQRMMTALRESHKGHMKGTTVKEMTQAAPFDEQPEAQPDTVSLMPSKSSRPLKKKQIEAMKKTKEVKDYTSPLFLQGQVTDAAAIRESGVGSLTAQVMNITPDDQSGLRIYNRQQKKKSDEITRKATGLLGTQNRFLQREAVGMLTGKEARGEKYQEWASRNSRHIQGAGEEERAFKKMRRSHGSSYARKAGKAKDELKSPAQIEKEMLIKKKHQLNDAGKHKEAAMLNKQIYKKSKRR